MIYNLCFKNYMGPWDNFTGDTIYNRVSSSSYICNVLELEHIDTCVWCHIETKQNMMIPLLPPEQ